MTITVALDLDMVTRASLSTSGELFFTIKRKDDSEFTVRALQMNTYVFLPSRPNFERVDRQCAELQLGLPAETLKYTGMATAEGDRYIALLRHKEYDEFYAQLYLLTKRAVERDAQRDLLERVERLQRDFQDRLPRAVLAETLQRAADRQRRIAELEASHQQGRGG